MTRTRRIWPLAMVLPLMVVLGGCDGNPAPAVRAALQAGKSARHFKPPANLPRNALPLSEAAGNLAAAPTPTPGQYVPEVRQALVQIRTADDEVESQYRELLVDALCFGMDQLGQQEQERRVGQEEWKSYLLDEFDRVGPTMITDYARDSAEQRIDEFLTAMNLASVRPRAAQAYAQHCVRVSP
jgi:hypothetical protein